MIVRLFARGAIAALVALAALGLAPPSRAQAPASHPSPASLLLAKQIVDIKGVKSIFDPLVRGVIEKAKDQYMQTNFMWSKDLNEVAAQMHKEYDSKSGELVDAAAKIYATHFTEAELKDLLTFYKSPLGRKMIAEEPKVLDESMINAGKWADDFSEDIMGKMRDEMKKRGHDL
jgi:hypothetical protein